MITVCLSADQAHRMSAVDSSGAAPEVAALASLDVTALEQPLAIQLQASTCRMALIREVVAVSCVCLRTVQCFSHIVC